MKLRSSQRRKWNFVFDFRLFGLAQEKSGSTKRGEGGRQHCPTGLTLHPLFPLALLFVLLLEFGYQARVHVPGLRNGNLLVLFYTGRTKPDREAVEELAWSRPDLPRRAKAHALLEASLRRAEGLRWAPLTLHNWEQHFQASLLICSRFLFQSM